MLTEDCSIRSLNFGNIPEKTVHQYINGRTKPFYSPLKYVIFWSAIGLLLIQFNETRSSADKTVEELVFNDHRIFTEESFDDFSLLYLQAMRDHLTFFYIFMVPFVAVISYLFYFNKKYSLVELLILYLYLTGQIAFILVVAVLCSLLFGESVGVLVSFLSLLPLLYLMIKSHKELFSDNWFKTIIKSLSVFYLGQILYLTTAYLVISLIKAV